jgi:hypothetical protein
MSRFIPTDRGYVNLNHVVSFRERRPKDSHHYADITYTEGGDVLNARADGIDNLDIEELTSPIIPAHPGYFVVFVYGEDVRDVRTVPVIAWRVSSMLDLVWPVCPGSESPTTSTNTLWAIVEPNGQVSTTDEGRFDTVGEFQRYAANRIKIEADRDTAIAAARTQVAATSMPPPPPPPPGFSAPPPPPPPKAA